MFVNYLFRFYFANRKFILYETQKKSGKNNISIGPYRRLREIKNVFTTVCSLKSAKNNTIKNSEQWILSLADHDLLICLLDFPIEIESVRYLCSKKKKEIQIIHSTKMKSFQHS